MLPKLNFKASPSDTRDHVLNFSKPASSLSLVDLSKFCTSIKDQGAIGSCTAHAGVALMEYFYKKNMSGKIDDLFSEKFLYYTTRVDVAKWPSNEDSGAYIRDTLKAMVQFGVCMESSFPYLRAGEKSCKYADSPAPSAYTEALNFQVTRYARISEINKSQCLAELKTLLQDGHAFVGGFTCYENIFNGSNGLIPPPSGKIIGGHAVLFVGFDDTKNVFKFKNSWSASWGDKGYGYLPYQYVLSGNMSDLWTIYQQEFNNKPFDVIVPVKRADEFSRRLKDILARLREGADLKTVTAGIQIDPSNSLVFKQDINELILFATRVHTLIISAQNNSSLFRV